MATRHPIVQAALRQSGLTFPRPLGVSPTFEADAALVADLKAQLARREAQLDEVLHAPKPETTEVRTFHDMDATWTEVCVCCSAIRALGQNPVMEWHGDPTGAVWLTVSVEVVPSITRVSSPRSAA